MKIPAGFEDTLNIKAYNKYILSCSILDLLQKNAYSHIETPIVEYYDNYAGNKFGLLPKDLFKLSDSDGNILVLKPNMKNALERLKTANLSRLCYLADAFIFSAEKRQSTLLGAAMFGVKPVTAAAEMLTLIIEIARKTGIPFSIRASHADILSGVTAEAGLFGAQAEDIKASLFSGNITNLPEKIVKVSEMKGGLECLSDLSNHTNSQLAINASLELCELYYTLAEEGLNELVSFDFSLQPYCQTDKILFEVSFLQERQVIRGGTSTEKALFEINIEKLLNVSLEAGSIEYNTPDILIAASEGITAQGAARKHARSLTDNGFIVELIYDADKAVAMQYARHKNIDNIIFINKQGKAEDAAT